jgi:Flp pilus assembly pilin Flp
MRVVKYPSPTIAFFLREEDGVSFTEYTLVVSLIVVVCVIAVMALGKGA